MYARPLCEEDLRTGVLRDMKNPIAYGCSVLILHQNHESGLATAGVEPSDDERFMLSGGLRALQMWSHGGKGR
jgi:hypothetical protein